MNASLDIFNALEPERFVAALGGVFEHSPWVAAAVCDQRPFATLDALHGAMLKAVEAAAPEQQLALIRAHPDLAGKAALAGTVTAQSRQEQSGAGLDRLGADEYRRFHDLNTAYRDKFDFPFILAVTGHDRASVLASFETRLGNDPETEKTRALAEIAKIARFRLMALLEEPRED